MIKRLKSKPKDFTFDELIALMGYLECELDSGGKTSGSAVKFYNNDGPVLFIHKPHPGKILKEYHVKRAIKELEERGLI